MRAHGLFLGSWGFSSAFSVVTLMRLEQRSQHRTVQFMCGQSWGNGASWVISRFCVLREWLPAMFSAPLEQKYNDSSKFLSDERSLSPNENFECLYRFLMLRSTFDETPRRAVYLLKLELMFRCNKTLAQIGRNAMQPMSALARGKHTWVGEEYIYSYLTFPVCM